MDVDGLMWTIYGISAILLFLGVARVRRWWLWQPVAVVAREDMVLRSGRLGLSGEPDRLLELRNGAVVPVEKKSGKKLRDGMIVQLGAYLMLVEEVFGRRPPFGVVVLGSGAQVRVLNTAWLRRRTRRVLASVRRQRTRLDTPARGTPFKAKCAKCGYLRGCEQGQRALRRRW